MKEKKPIKVRLSTVILCTIILILLAIIAVLVVNNKQCKIVIPKDNEINQMYTFKQVSYYR